MEGSRPLAKTTRKCDSHALSVNVVKSLDDLYGLSAMKNSEIRCKWLQPRLAAGDAGAFEPASGEGHADVARTHEVPEAIRPMK